MEEERGDGRSVVQQAERERKMLQILFCWLYDDLLLPAFLQPVSVVCVSLHVCMYV